MPMLVRSSGRYAIQRLAVVACVAVGGLSAAGCSENYEGERMLWKAQRLANPILSAKMPPTVEQIQPALAALRHVVAETPETQWAPQAQLLIGSMYLKMKDYDKARDAFRLILQNYSQYRGPCEQSRVAIAKSHEASAQWPEAIAGFQELADYHPLSRLGLEAPLYIAALYERRGDTLGANKAKERAIKHFVKLIQEAPNPDVEAGLKGFLALAYQVSERWRDAAATLEDMNRASSASVNRPLVLMTLASLYQLKLNQPTRARELYETMLKEFPDHAFAKSAETQIKRIEHPEMAPTLPSAPLPAGGALTIIGDSSGQLSLDSYVLP